MLQWFANLSFRRKIALPILLLAVLLLLVGALGVHGIAQLNESNQRLGKRFLPGIALLLNADRDLYQAFVAERSLLEGHLSAEQIAVLQEQGFELRDEGWEFGMSSKVLFGNNLDRLNPDSRNTLTKIARALLAVDIDKVRLEGHTDNYGDEGYNQKLSERRAESVAAVFREAGMPAANIEVRGLGMSKPVADNKTRAGRSENRRVAIIVPAE